jgi:hypothetical protein
MDEDESRCEGVEMAGLGRAKVGSFALVILPRKW